MIGSFPQALESLNSHRYLEIRTDAMSKVSHIESSSEEK